MRRRDEIAPDAVLEVRVYPPEVSRTAENDPAIALLEAWIAAAPTDPEKVRRADAEAHEVDGQSEPEPD